VACGLLLAGYWALMSFVPAPGQAAVSFAPGQNLANWIDAHYLPGWLYDKTFDPEGLLSTLPVTTAAEAIEKVRWYSLRWGIEVFHKITKSVCGAEAHQFETRERLERMLMLDLLLAWRLFVLTLVGRENPDLLASDYFAESQWKALYSYINKTSTVPEQAPTLGQMTQWLGRLGGFVKCKATPHPGAITLTRGLERLEDLTTMWRIQNSDHAKGG
jgi:hypothetical protein